MRDILEDLEAGRLLSDPDPVKRAQNQMRTALPKRFYTTVTVEQQGEGFVVKLDGKSVRTPAKALLALPTQAAAQIGADEFAAQEDVINPVTMPAMRLVNTAIDGVANEPDAVAEDVLRFASSDLLCYRADAPEGLVARQNEAWDPVLDWALSALGARFVLAEGIVHVAQPPAAIGALRIHIDQRREPNRLAGLHLMTSLTGSALLALAVDAEAITAEEAWRAAHVDEDWQIDHWGQDSEAVARRNARWRDMNAAARIIGALRSSA
jgi:chaperone required for assembly of F1-ATPase